MRARPVGLPWYLPNTTRAQTSRAIKPVSRPMAAGRLDRAASLGSWTRWEPVLLDIDPLSITGRPELPPREAVMASVRLKWLG